MKRTISTFLLLWVVLAATCSQKIASPSVKFNVDETVSATTGATSNVTMASATLAGTVNGASIAKKTAGKEGQMKTIIVWLDNIFLKRLILTTLHMIM